MIKILHPEISDKAIDHRGAIYSYVPADSIREVVYITTKAGVERGHHYHKEFDEYIMLVEGEGVYDCPMQNEKIVIGPGQVIYMPKGHAHTFIPITDCKAVSLLTKPWNECNEPITVYP
jgi:mannose-6-phosphate isomerase-like protein (cupin superfamily)